MVDRPWQWDYQILMPKDLIPHFWPTPFMYDNNNNPFSPYFQLKEFVLFERNLMELASFSRKLPSDACAHPEPINSTTGPNVTTESATPSPITETPPHEKKHHHNKQV